ncbi:MAG TPA: nucleotide sugar dehydrogenase [Methanomassiliicoccales archaeon]|jgi:UDP-N-acetyl-D-mannosaminuronic acid dehydrogenase
MVNEKVAVVGIGYVGLPLACVLAESGFRTTGIDVDKDRVDLVNSGKCPIVGEEPGLPELLKKVILAGSLKASSKPEDLAGCDAVFVCVDTPIDKDKKPRLEILRSAVTTVGRSMKKGSLISIESTLPPGTMKNVVIPILEKESGLRVGRDFLLCHCPERVMPGKLLNNMRKVERVLGGFDSESIKRGAYFYSRIVQAEIHPSDLLSAEISKTSENAYRDVQIAFANEVALLCEKLGADAFEVRRLVNTCPSRDMHIPGSGVGGHCLPKDSWLLLSGAPDNTARVIPYAREVNESMPHHVAELAKGVMTKAKVTAARPRVAIMGLAFLRDSDDVRESPAIKIIDDLVGEFELIVHDPFVKNPYKVEMTRDLEAALGGADCAVFVTDHTAYRTLDLQKVKRLMRTPAIVDGRNIFNQNDAQRNGLVYAGVGKGPI